MEPGNELNKRVAVEIMGWTEVAEVTRAGTAIVELQGVAPGTKPSPYTGYKPKILVPRFSEDMNAAMLVDQKLDLLNSDLPDNKGRMLCRSDGKWHIAEGITGTHWEFTGKSTAGLTAAHVICLAGLEVVNARSASYQAGASPQSPA
jgi:hypothetical protein